MFVKERSTSRAGTNAFEGSTGKLEYDIQLEDAETETSAYDYLVANAPATFTTVTGSLYQYQSVAITPVDVGNRILLGEVIYAQTKPLQFSFQTGGGSEKVDYSRASIRNFSLASFNTTGLFSGRAAHDGEAAGYRYVSTDGDGTPPNLPILYIMGSGGAGDWSAHSTTEIDVAPDFKQGINVTKTSIEGVTIRTANFQFKITKSWAKGKTISAYGTFAGRTAKDAEATGYRYLSTDGDGTDGSQPILYVHGVGAGVWAAATHVTGEIDGEYMRDVERMTGMFNLYAVTILIEGIWMHFLPGELFFEGTDGGKTVDNRFELTSAFAVSRNIEPDDPDSWRRVGEIEVTEKRGWDLIWIYSEESEDTVTKTMTRTPKACYVERVYDFDDFAKLRLDE